MAASYDFETSTRYHIVYPKQKYLAALLRPHHIFGPSTLPYRARCPAWMPIPGGTVAADYGTRQHELMAVAESWARTDLLKEMDWAATWALQFVNKLQARLASPLYRQKKPRVKRELLVEIKDGEEKITWGYVDIVILSHAEHRADMVDYKFGWTEVDHPEHNLQLLCYVIGLFQKFPKLEAVRAWIVQPRLGVSERPRAVSATWVRDPEFMASALDTIKRIINEAKELHDAPLDVWAPRARPNMHSCFYCLRLTECPAARAQCQEAVKKTGAFAEIGGLQEILNRAPSNKELLENPVEALEVLQIARRYIQRVWAIVTEKVIGKIKESGKVPARVRIVEQRQWHVQQFRPLVRELKRRYKITEADLLKISRPPPWSEIVDLLVRRGLTDEQLLKLMDSWKTKGFIDYQTRRPYLLLQTETETETETENVIDHEYQEHKDRENET